MADKRRVSRAEKVTILRDKIGSQYWLLTKGRARPLIAACLAEYGGREQSWYQALSDLRSEVIRPPELAALRAARLREIAEAEPQNGWSGADIVAALRLLPADDADSDDGPTAPVKVTLREVKADE